MRPERLTALGTAIERRARALLVLLLAAVAAITLVLAHRKPLWNDELFTYYISRLPGVDDMWSELTKGVEQTPLSFYVATRASLDVLGEGGIAIRMPELLGFLLMSVCVFLFVERRSSPLYGLVAAIFPITTVAYGYAYEARAYGLVLGFSAAALLCWQVAAEGGPHRRLAALGTAVSLAAAVGSHYYAVLILVPLLVGEVARSSARRRVDWLVLGSFSGALLPLLAFAPLIAEAKDYSTTFWAQPTWHAAIRFYPDSLMDRALGVVVAVLAAIVVFAAWRAWRTRRRAAGLRLPPSHELAALVTLVLLPFFGVALGKLVTGAFTDRYVLPAILGITILIALAAWWTDGGVPLLGVSLLLVFAVFAGARIVERQDDATIDADAQTQALAFLDEHGQAGEPIAVASPHDFFELSHRAAQQGGPRLIYLSDPALARKYLQTDAVELGVVGMKDVAQLRVERYRRFIASHSRFVVYGRYRAWDWLTSALQADGAERRVIARNSQNDAPLVEVRPPGIKRP